MKSAMLCFVILISLSPFPVEVAAQCTCGPRYDNMPAINEFRVRDVVFVGKVISVRKTVPDRRNNSYTQIVNFEVTQLWKGEVGQTVTITNVIQGCINSFKAKEEYLVYAYKSRNEKLGTGCCCSRTKPLSKAMKDLEEFSESGEKPRQVQSRKG